MGKPYDHQYFFAGYGGRAGSMICAHCNQPIFGHNQDWMHYSKTCKDEAGWPDWKYVCFHRKCREDQSGWEKIERAKFKEKKDFEFKIKSLKDVAEKIGVTCPYEFADLAATSLGEDDLDGHYFDRYGSC